MKTGIKLLGVLIFLTLFYGVVTHLNLTSMGLAAAIVLCVVLIFLFLYVPKRNRNNDR